jgi:hypothetical protein
MTKSNSELLGCIEGHKGGGLCKVGAATTQTKVSTKRLIEIIGGLDKYCRQLSFVSRDFSANPTFLVDDLTNLTEFFRPLFIAMHH